MRFNKLKYLNISLEFFQFFRGFFEKVYQLCRFVSELKKLFRKCLFSDKTARKLIDFTHKAKVINKH